MRRPLDDHLVELLHGLREGERRDWLELFPFLTTRRPDAYARLLEPHSPEG